MPAQPRAFERPFRGGMVRDLVRAQQGMASAWTLEDAMFVNGVVEKRGPLRRAGGSTIDGSTSDIIYGAIPYTPPGGSPGIAVTYYDESAGIYYAAMHDSATYGSSGTITTATKAELSSSIPYYPSCVYRGEVILTPNHSTTGGIILRYSGAGDDATAPTGTISIAEGSDAVVGVGTNFTTTMTRGAYISVLLDTGYIYYCVDDILSNTSCRLRAPADFAISGVSWTPTGAGRFNIQTNISERGLVTTAPTTTITGVATDWASTTYEQILSGDLIGRTSIGESTEVRLINSTPVSDTSLTVSAAPSGAWSNDKFRITRHLVGRVAATHQGRLYTAGLGNLDNDRLQVTPADYSMSAIYNGVDSPLTAAIQARTVDSFSVAGEGSPGHIVALASMPEPGPLLVLKTSDTYAVYGEPPNVNVIKVGNQHGCIQPSVGGEAVVTGPEGAFWLGPENVWRWPGGGAPQGMMNGRIERLYRRIMSFDPDATAGAITLLNGHLFVSVSTWEYEAASQTAYFTWVCDLESGAWSEWNNAKIRLPRRYDSDSSYREVVYVDLDQRYNLRLLRSSVEGEMTTGDYTGTFLLETGDNILAELGDYTRVTDMKIVYELYPATARVTVGFDVGAGFSTAATLAGVADDGTSPVQTTLVPLGGTVMGTKHRHLRLKLAEAVAATRFRIHEVQFMVRGFKPET